MVSALETLRLVNRRLSRLLDIAEAALPPRQFRAFRKVALNEFGRSGLGFELVEIERSGQSPDSRNGIGRHDPGTERR